jgi:hypothetical protein
MSTRPNLGGLFNGSTPPDRSSSISGSVRPRLVTSSNGGGDKQSGPAAPSGRDANPKSPEENNSAAQPPTALGWVDPVRAVERYFEFLAAVLEANRELAVAITGMVTSLPLRVSTRRTAVTESSRKVG